MNAKYKKQLVLGVIDPDSTIKKFNDELKKVGIDEYIAESQKMYDEYLKTLK